MRIDWDVDKEAVTTTGSGSADQERGMDSQRLVERRGKEGKTEG